MHIHGRTLGDSFTRVTLPARGGGRALLAVEPGRDQPRGCGFANPSRSGEKVSVMWCPCSDSPGDRRHFLALSLDVVEGARTILAVEGDVGRHSSRVSSGAADSLAFSGRLRDGGGAAN